MIPQKLTLKGIYSYQQEQVVDFRKLTAAQLFGIFGPVGSGKSTILEAITFALYGETERLNNRDNRQQNMRNLKSDQMLIRFNFLAGEDFLQEYCFEVTLDARKKSSNFKRVQKIKQNGRWFQKELHAEEIIGLSYQNFRRTVIIPQGKFQEFLQLGPTERTRMLREIFNLQRFELSQNVKSLISKNEISKANIQGQLQQLGEINSETIVEKTKQLSTEKKTLKSLQLKFSRLNKEAIQMSKLRELVEKITLQESKLAEMNARADDFKQREARLTAYQECVAQFKSPLEKLADMETQIRQVNQELAEMKSRESTEKPRFEDLTHRFEKAQKEFVKRDRWQQAADDLQVLRRVRKLTESVKLTTSEITRVNETLAEQASEIDKKSQHQKELFEGIKQLKRDLPEPEKLYRLQNWYKELALMDEHVRQQEKKIEESQQSLLDIQAQKTARLMSESLSFWSASKKPEAPLPDLLRMLTAEIKQHQAHSEKLADGLHHLRVQAQLETFANELQPGAPCPLCGAKEHPAVMNVQNISKQLALQEAEKQTLDARIAILQDAQQFFQRLHDQQVTQEKLAISAETDLQKSQQKRATHLKNFNWKGFDPQDSAAAETAIENARQQRVQLEKLENQKERQGQDIEEKRIEVEKLSKKLSQLEIQRTHAITERETLLKSLKQIQAADYANYDEEQLESSAAEFLEKYHQTGKAYQQLEQEKTELQNLLARLAGQIQTAEQNLNIQQKAAKKIEQQLHTQITSSVFEDINEVKQLLSLDLNTVTERREIANFYQEKHTAETQLAQLKNEAGNQKYDAAKHEQAQREFELLNEQLVRKTRQIGSLESELDAAKRGLELRLSLEKEKIRLENRGRNLEILRKMFSASGFVNFVSKIYLQNLCNAANERFRRLTRQQLQLELADDNNFIVRDFLNGGKTRSVKTLSGGQTFQASLCLALTLADNVRYLSKSEQNFFFLDEGFGTLDKESLHLVFETLKSLRKENRIIGVISHVEEMQDEIDVYLRIQNEKDKGSQISASWEE